MADYEIIEDEELGSGKPGTVSIFTRLRDNLTAVQENDPSAPNVAYAVAAGNSQTIQNQGALATENSVDQALIDANAVGISELKASSGVVSGAGTGPADVTLPGGQYGFYPQIKTNNASYAALARIADALTSTSYITNIKLYSDNTSGVTSAQQTYIEASPPYDLGDGVVGLFIFAMINNTTGKIESVYQAPEAPWHYNGKTDIRGKLDPDGKKYRVRKNMENMPFALSDIKNDKVKLKEYIDAFTSAKTVKELITQEICQLDMIDIPHPFISNNLKGKTVVMLDPVCDLNHQLQEMSKHDEFDLNQLIHDEYFTIDNSDIGLVSPNGVLVPSFKWKKTEGDK
jgi:hypothetical protein